MIDELELAYILGRPATEKEFVLISELVEKRMSLWDACDMLKEW